jgi:hypothetical protein
MPIVPQEVSQFVGQGKPLLICGIAAIDEDQSLARARDQTGPQ